MTRIAVDTSALMALVYREPDWQAYHDALLGNEPRLSAGSLVELGRILTVRFQHAGEEKLEVLLRTYRGSGSSRTTRRRPAWPSLVRSRSAPAEAPLPPS